MVVLSKEDYIKEADRQLIDQTYYQQLTADLTIQHAAEIKKFVNSMATRGLIDKKTKEFLIPYNPRVARFYLLPKIHKPGNPGRPIVSSNGAPKENISHTIYKCMALPWEPVWPLHMLTCSWGSWTTNFRQPRTGYLECGGGIWMTSLPYGRMANQLYVPYRKSQLSPPHY